MFHGNLQADVENGAWALDVQLIMDGDRINDGGYPGADKEPKPYVFIARHAAGQETAQTVAVRYSEFEPSDR